MAHTAKSSVIHDNISWCFDRQNGNAMGSRRHHENIEYDPESQQDTESRFARDYVRLHLAIENLIPDEEEAPRTQ